jgi:hypothetical protein
LRDSQLSSFGFMVQPNSSIVVFAHLVVVLVSCMGSAAVRGAALQLSAWAVGPDGSKLAIL